MAAAAAKAENGICGGNGGFGRRRPRRKSLPNGELERGEPLRKKQSSLEFLNEFLSRSGAAIVPDCLGFKGRKCV